MTLRNAPRIERQGKLPFSRLFSQPPDFGEYFRILADQLDEGLFLIHPRSGMIAEVNHAAAALTGYPRAELCSRSLAELIDIQSAPHVLNDIHRYSNRFIQTLNDVPLRTHSGRTVNADLRLLQIEDHPSRPMVLVFASKSEFRVEAERRAKLLPHLLQCILMLSELSLDPDEKSLQSTLKVGTQMLWAQAAGFYSIAMPPPRLVMAASLNVPAAFPNELPEGEFLALNSPVVWNKAIRPDNALTRAARAADWGALFAFPIGKVSEPIGLAFVGYRSGDSPPTEASLVISLFAQHLELLMQRVARTQALLQAQKELAEKSALLEALMTNSQDAVLVCDAHGKIVQANRAAELILGFEDGELVGSRTEDVLVSQQSLGFAFEAALIYGETSASKETWLHRRTGQSFPAFLSVAPLCSPELAGRAYEPNRVLLTVRDLSEQRAIETRTLQLEQRALLGEVSAIFAHEVRNPLNGISSGVQLLSSRLGADHPLQDTASKIISECTRLSQLMKDVLDFARPLQLKIAPNDLGALVQRVLARWSAKMARQGITLHCDLQPEAPPALLDPRSMEQVITNLVDNAIQAMPEGGTLSVNLAPAAMEQTGPAVVLNLTDSGPGMPEEVRRRVFDPFYTTKTHGTGLGLAITKRILNVHNGSIRVKSFEGIGSTFSISLPAAVQDKKSLVEESLSPVVT